MAMRLTLHDSVCLAGGLHNDDRWGLHGAFAWVIDGATDVLEERILPGPSDAAWFADALSAALMAQVRESAASLDTIIEAATDEVRERFARASKRAVSKPHEQPSAAGIVLRVGDGHLQARSLGDCTLLALGDEAAHDLLRGDGPREADDALRDAVARMQESGQAPANTSPHAIRSELKPRLRAERDRLNAPDGYPIFSLEMPEFGRIARVSTRARHGDRFLLATDGFMRLVDVYGIYDLRTLREALCSDGLARLAYRLRRAEGDDPDGVRWPRVKMRDDATAVVFEVIG